MIVTLSPLTALPSEGSASNGTILHTHTLSHTHTLTHTHTHSSTITLYLQTVKQGTARKRNKVKQQATGSSSSAQHTSTTPPSQGSSPAPPAVRTRRRGKERRSTAQQQGSSQSASDDAMMTGAKDHNSLTDVSSYFQHTQSSDDDFEEEEFIPPQSKRSSLAGKLATLCSADSSTGKRSKKGTQPAKQRRSKRLRQEAAAPQVERSSPSSPSERVMDSLIVQDEASVPPSKRLKKDRSNPPQPKERSSSTVSDTATGSPLVYHDGLDQDTSRGDQAALYGKLDKMALPTQLVYLFTDDTSSWVEVLLEGRQWRSLHIPSLSLGQPQLCEKHCPRELSYVLAIDNGEWLR